MTQEEIWKVKDAIMKNIIIRCDIFTPSIGDIYVLLGDVRRAIQETEIETKVE